HGEAVVALPDAQRDGFAGIPLLLFGPLVRVALPLGAGQHAAQFARQVDAGDLAEAQRLHEIVDEVDAHLVGQRVVVDVARQLDRAAHVDAADVAFGAAETVPGEVVVARIVD